MTNQIRTLRLAKGFTLQELADRIGTSKSQIDKLEKGDRRLTLDWMQRIAGGLECTITDIITAVSGFSASNESAPFPLQSNSNKDLPLVGNVRGGIDGFFFDNGKVSEYVNRPVNLIGVSQAFAVYTVGDSMEPRFYAGELLYVHPNRPLTRDCFVVIEMQDGQGFVKQYKKQDDASITLFQFNPEKEIIMAKSRVKNLFRVVGSSENL